jgi:3-oxoacyl-(acyl-carrier-protein) synthase
MIVHDLGAAGVLEAIASIKAINTGWLHPTIKVVKSIKGGYGFESSIL